MFKRGTQVAIAMLALALVLPSLASAAPAPWGDKNNVDATVCSTYGRDGTQAIVKPSPGTDTSCVKPGGGGNNGSAPDNPVVGSPADGSEFTQGQVVNVSYSCSDPDQAMPAPTNCKGYQCPASATSFDPCTIIAPGAALDTSTPGSYVFSVWAVDDQGNLNSTVNHFTVVADADGDGVKDSLDQCSGTAAGAVVDANGCSADQLDSDGDGVNDGLDKCPGTAAGAVVDADGCSADQRDSDGDGVNDALDQCPATPALSPADANGCSADQRDSDGDGVNDALDKCPGTVAGATVGADGCVPVKDSGSGNGSGSGSGNGSGNGSGSGDGSNNGSGSNDGSGSGTPAANTPAETAVVDPTDDEQLVLGARLAACNVVMKVSRKQKGFRTKGLILTVRSNRSCSVKLSGKLIPAKRAGARKAKVNTEARTFKLVGGKTQTVKLRFTKKGLRYLKRSLMGKVTRARIFVTDGPGVNQKLNRSFTIRIKG